MKLRSGFCKINFNIRGKKPNSEETITDEEMEMEPTRTNEEVPKLSVSSHYTSFSSSKYIVYDLDCEKNGYRV